MHHWYVWFGCYVDFTLVTGVVYDCLDFALFRYSWIAVYTRLQTFCYGYIALRWFARLRCPFTAVTLCVGYPRLPRLRLHAAVVVGILRFTHAAHWLVGYAVTLLRVTLLARCPVRVTPARLHLDCALLLHVCSYFVADLHLRYVARFARVRLRYACVDLRLVCTDYARTFAHVGYVVCWLPRLRVITHHVCYVGYVCALVGCALRCVVVRGWLRHPVYVVD